jgi:hypothetical protein
MLKKIKKKSIAILILVLCIVISISVLMMNNLNAASVNGSVPSIFGDELLIGLFENRSDTWMEESEVDWNSRYMYLTKGWSNNWGWGDNDGSFAKEYMEECNNIGTMPVLEYYIMNSMDGGGEDQFYDKTTNSETMYDYFSDYKILLEAAKEYGKPVIILLEADGFGFLQNQTESDSDAYCAVKSSGLEELSELPDTAAGWGMTFLELRNSVGADNVMLGMHISAWASGEDIIYGSVNLPLEDEVEEVYGFLKDLGLDENQTGSTYDFLVTDPLDRDADYYRLTSSVDKWLDDDDDASISSQSFNRYAEWLRLWNEKSNKRWILWQIPMGNSESLNVYNSGNAGEGYKDNKTEYFLGENSEDHLEKFIDSGVVALLFGRGADGQTNYTNDNYTDGELYLKSRAKTFFENGGIKVTDSGSTTTTSPTNTEESETPTESENIEDSTATVIYQVQNDWGSGATVSVTINNNDDSDIDGWSLIWNYNEDQEITNIWNAEYTQEGNSVTVSNNLWNSTISANGTVTFGFNLTYSEGNSIPDEFNFNDLDI